MNMARRLACALGFICGAGAIARVAEEQGNDWLARENLFTQYRALLVDAQLSYAPALSIYK